VRIQIAGELAILARQRASGALEISDHPGGTVFLSGGYLTFAESPAVPDLRSRLICTHRLTAGQWDEIIKSDRVPGGVSALLVSQGILTQAELRDFLRSITFDVLVALAVPLSAEPLAASIRFWPRRSHWTGSVLRLDFAPIWSAVEQKAEPLARHNIRAVARPQLCELSRSWAVVKPGPWAVAGQIDGHATVQDLAWRNGFALCDVMEWVGELLQAGLCTVAAPAAGTPAAAAPAATGAAREGPESHERRPGRRRPRLGERRARTGKDLDSSGKSPQLESPPEQADGVILRPEPTDGAAPPLPQRKPGTTLAARPAKAEMPDIFPWHPEVIQTPPEAPHADLLHRILKGLRRIN